MLFYIMHHIILNSCNKNSSHHDYLNPYILINKSASLETDLTTNTGEIQEIIRKFYLLFRAVRHVEKSRDVTKNSSREPTANESLCKNS